MALCKELATRWFSGDLFVIIIINAQVSRTRQGEEFLATYVSHAGVWRLY